MTSKGETRVDEGFGAPRLRVEDRRALRILTDERQLRFFAPFFGRTRTIADVARELDVPVNAVFARVRRFCAAGLLKQVEALPRRGRPQKLYRSVADAFFIPLSGPELRRVQELHDRYFSEWFIDSALQAARDCGVIRGESGLTFFRRDDGGLDSYIGQERRQPGEPTPVPLLWCWVELDLTTEQARDLEQRVRQAIRQYRRSPPAPGARRYLCGSFLAPALPDRPPMDPR